MCQYVVAQVFYQGLQFEVKRSVVFEPQNKYKILKLQWIMKCMKKYTWMSYCMWRLFITYGFLNFSYWIALSRGKPFEWNEIKQSQIGHSSTGFCEFIRQSEQTFPNTCHKNMDKQSTMRCSYRITYNASLVSNDNISHMHYNMY